MADALELPGYPEKGGLPPNSNYPDSTSSSMSPQNPNTDHLPPTTGMPYSQQYAPPPGGHPYYPPPGMVYPGQPGMVYPGQPGFGYQTPQQQQQQQQVLVVGNQPSGATPVFIVSQPQVHFTGAILLSCFAYWCFGGLFGGIAFILAMVGQNAASAGDIPGAIRLRNASYGVSIAGIIVVVIIVAILAGVLARAATKIAEEARCSYKYDVYYGTYRYSCN